MSEHTIKEEGELKVKTENIFLGKEEHVDGQVENKMSEGIKIKNENAEFNLIEFDVMEENKFDVKEENISGEQKSFKRQLEYYFGDYNLPQDKYLQNLIKLNDGWVALRTVLKFPRMKRLISEVIVGELANSKLLEISEDKLQIRRYPNNPPPVWNEERRKDIMSRTLYMKGFPVENTTLDMLLDFFARKCVIENITMMSCRDKVAEPFVFKGSVFVTFPTKEKAEEILNKALKYKDTKLIKKWQCDYLEDERKEKIELKSMNRGSKSGIKCLKRTNKMSEHTIMEEELKVKNENIFLVKEKHVDRQVENKMSEGIKIKNENAEFNLIEFDVMEENKFDVKEENISGEQKSFKRQLEYYFGDYNLPQDKYLQNLIKLHDGWVLLSTVFKFPRMKRIISKVIVGELANSKLLEISEDKLQIRRCPNYPPPVWSEERRKEIMSRTLSMKGFPVENTTLDMLLDFFASKCVIENLTMTSCRDKAAGTFVFKGSVFVTFPTKEKAEEILNEALKYKDTELIKKWQCDYLEDERKEIMERKFKNRGSTSGIKRLKRTVQKKRKSAKGAILHIKGLNAALSGDVIKIKLTEEFDADISFVYFNKGEKEGWIGLRSDKSAKKILKKVGEKKFKLCGTEIKVRVLKGKERKRFLVKYKEERKLQNQKKKCAAERASGGKGGFSGDRKRVSSSVPEVSAPKLSKSTNKYYIIKLCN